MLEMFRNAGKSWVAKILLVLLAGSFGVWGIQDIFGGFNATALATVGNQEISGQQYSNSYRQAMQRLAQQTGQNLTAEDARRMGIDRSILSGMIQSAAIDAQASNLKLSISRQLIAEEAKGNPAFQSNGQFDPQLFARILQQNGLNEEMYVASESRNRAQYAITDAVARGFKPPNTFVEALYQYRNEQRDAKYFTINASEADVPAPTDEELKRQYDATPTAYTAPEFRSIAVMKVEPADMAPKIAIASEALSAGYEKYKRNYYTPEKRTILQISFPTIGEAERAKARISAGEDFMAIAKERGASEADITFADKSKAEFLDKTVAEAAFNLKQDEVSEPVSGSLVTALLKAAKIAPEKQASLDEVKDELTKRLQAERALDEIQSIYDAVEDARAAQTKFEDIAKAQGIPFVVVPAVSATGLGPDGKEVDLPGKADVLKAAFASDVGVENDALTPHDSYFWYEVREVIPSALKPLDTVKSQLTSDVTARKVRGLLTERATSIVKKLYDGATLEQLASEAASEIKTAQGLKRNEANAEFDVPAVTALFSVPEKEFSWSLEGDGKTAKIMQSQSVLAEPYSSNSPQAKELAQSVKDAATKDLLTVYLTALQGQIGVSINNALWQQVSGSPNAAP
ncbi:MAG: SurA N-terminal domain-containing protein [Aestuariivirga sp.]|nr:SurA N-terminal domain-containing protein [Aestuariivirga sp.]